jgi:hypothetical protein
MMTHEDGCWVTVNVTEETFFSAVLHLDWATSLEREQAAMHLQTDIFASTECTANSAKREAHFLSR